MKERGIVTYSDKNKFGGWSLQIDSKPGAWFNTKFTCAAKVGDEVEFDSGSTGKYINGLKVLSGGNTADTTKGPAYTPPKPGFPIDPLDKQRSIIRQNSLAHAVELVDGALPMVVDGLDDASVITDNVRDALLARAELVVKVARKFESYSSGDSDRSMIEAILNGGGDKSE